MHVCLLGSEGLYPAWEGLEAQRGASVGATAAYAKPNPSWPSLTACISFSRRTSSEG